MQFVIVLALAVLVATLFIRHTLRERRLRSWLPGKRVVIIGASSGIGEQIALLCARHSVQSLVIASRRITRLLSLADRCRSLGASSVVVRECDIRSSAACTALLSTSEAAVDLLVICSGIGQDFGFSEMQPERVIAPLIETNLLGPILLTHVALPALIRSNGRVLVVASMSAVLPRPRRALYAATKAALVALFENLRTEGIKATIAMPGFVNTELAAGISRIRADGQPAAQTSQETRRHRHGFLPVMDADKCAHSLLLAAANDDRRVVTPWWFALLWVIHSLCPALFERFVK